MQKIYIRIYMWSARNSRTVTEYFIVKRKLSELFIFVRFYRGNDSGSDHFLTLAKFRIPPRSLHLPKNTACKGNIFHYKIRLLSCESIRWLYKQRSQQKLQEIPESSNIILEWRNINTIISQAADESWGKYKAFTQNRKLKTWNDEIKLIVQQK